MRTKEDMLMKKTLENLCTLFIWIGILIIGFIIYRSKAIGCGEYAYKTFLAFEKILF